MFLSGTVLAAGILAVLARGASPQGIPITVQVAPPPEVALPAPAGRSLLAAHLEEISPATGLFDSSEEAAAAAFQITSGAGADAKPPGPRVLTYTIQPGDTMWGLGQQFAVDEDTVRSMNPGLDPKKLQPGQQIKILTVKGTMHVVKKGETLDAIARLYSLTTVAIADANSLTDLDNIQVGMELILPGAKRLAVSAAGGGSGAGGGWNWPLRGRITSQFGPRWGSHHDGLDIAAATGTPARAARSGRVTFAGWYGAYGNTVVIDHGDGVQSLYAHASKILVSKGARVDQGESVIRVGSTGRSTGPHLHFEIIVSGKPRNPRPFLP